jgi:hypothetical protein
MPLLMPYLPGMDNDPGRDTKQRLSVAQAADALGLTVDAVRSRIARGTIEHVRESGRVYVLLNSDEYRQGRDKYTDKGSDQVSDLTDELRDRLHYVEGQLEAERQAHGEARRLLAAALERIPAIEAAPDKREGTEAADDQQGSAMPRPDTLSPEKQSARPWWRRMFGG